MFVRRVMSEPRGVLFHLMHGLVAYNSPCVYHLAAVNKVAADTARVCRTDTFVAGLTEKTYYDDGIWECFDGRIDQLRLREIKDGGSVWDVYAFENNKAFLYIWKNPVRIEMRIDHCHRIWILQDTFNRTFYTNGYASDFRTMLPTMLTILQTVKWQIIVVDLTIDSVEISDKEGYKEGYVSGRINDDSLLLEHLSRGQQTFVLLKVVERLLELSLV